MASGRSREITEIVRIYKVIEVLKVIKGQVNDEMSQVSADMMKHWTRKQIRAAKKNRKFIDARAFIKDYCRRNFPRVSVEQCMNNLAGLYEKIYANQKHGLRLTVPELDSIAGKKFRLDALPGTPPHATIHITIKGGLQSEYPEFHLMKDLAVLFNELVITHLELLRWEKEDIHIIKANQAEIRPIQRHSVMCRRMCLLACFNLVEAYLNGLAWEYNNLNDVSGLTRRQRDMIQKGQGSVLQRIRCIPAIIANAESPFDEDSYPLRDFKDVLKPYRDSIVHASPFAAPEKFGGYDKLQKIYDLEADTVVKAVNVTEAIIGTIHEMLGGEGALPNWYLPRDQHGHNKMFVFD